MKIKKYLPHILTTSGVLGVFASVMLVLDEIGLLKNPGKDLDCNINPIIACGSVIATDQAEAFGFPNPLIGVAGFGGLLAIGIALLMGARLTRCFWQFVQVGLLLAVIFVHWLFFETVYRIGALCPYCMVVWVASITSFWYLLIYNLGTKNIKPPKRLAKLSAFAQKHHFDLLVVWFLVIIGLILNHFWYYWQTLI